MKKKKPSATTQPVQLSLLQHPTFNPSQTPRRSLVQSVELERMDEHGQRHMVPSTFRIEMPAEETLPQVHHMQVLDALNRDLVRLGVPADDTIPFSYTNTLRDLGLSRSGKNYETVYEAIDKFFKMAVTYQDISTVATVKKGLLPFLTKARIISSFNIRKPEHGDKAILPGESWIRFEKWYSEGFRRKNDRKYLSTAVLSSFNVGDTRRIYEVIKKFMGDKEIYTIGIKKLGRWIPYIDVREPRILMQKTKRAIEQLKESKAFGDIEIVGRGDKAMVTFHKWDEGREKPERGKADKKEEGTDPGTLSFYLSGLRQLMTEEAIQEGRAKSKEFQRDLVTTEKIFVAVIEKWENPPLSVIEDALLDTKAAFKEGRIKTTVRQFFVDTLGRYCGKK